MFGRKSILKKPLARKQKSTNKKIIGIFLVILFLSVGLLIYLITRGQLFSVVLVSPVPSLVKKEPQEKLDTKLLATVTNIKEIERQLEKQKITFETVEAASDSSILVRLVGGGRALLSQKKDLVSQISSLQLLLSRFTIEGKHIDMLDFRFDRPVVTFKNP